MKVIDLKAPTCMDELTAEQSAYIGKLYSLGLEREEFLTFAFLKFCNLKILKSKSSKKYRFKRRQKFSIFHSPFSIKTEDFRFFCEKLSFLTDETGLTVAPYFSRYIAPDSHLYNISLDDYIICDFAYMNFVHTNDYKHLKTIFKTLWKPKCKLLRKLSNFNFQFSIYLWWTGLKNYLKTEYPYIFSAAGDGGEISQKNIVLGLLASFNDGKPQNNAEILKTSAHEIFYELNKKMNPNLKKQFPH